MARRRCRAPTGGTPTVVPDAPGLWTLRRRGVERPARHLAPRGHGQDRRRPGRRGPRQRPRGGRPAVRAAGRGRLPSRAPRGAGRGAAALRDTDASTSPTASRPALTAGAASSSLHDHPVRELVTTLAALPVWVDRPRALYGSWYEFFPRSIGAELAGDPLAPARPLGTAPSRRDRAPDDVADDGLRRRLPAADPPDRRGQPQGPEQHPRSPAQLGRRLAVGDRLARRRARRHPPRARARWTTSRRSSRAPASWAWRSRSTSRCRRRPTTRG